MDLNTLQKFRKGDKPMLRKTFQNQSFLYIRINKVRAKHMFEKGEKVFVIPCNSFMGKEKPKILQKGKDFATKTFDFEVCSYDLLSLFPKTKKSKYPSFYTRKRLTSRRKPCEKEICI